MTVMPISPEASHYFIRLTLFCSLSLLFVSHSLAPRVDRTVLQ